MKVRFLSILMLSLPLVGLAQPAPDDYPRQADEKYPQQADTVENGIPEHILHLADTLAAVNQIHGPYVGFDGETTEQYKNFVKLSELACPDELLLLTSHDNAVVRGYAFWALARQQYTDLDKVLLNHARDETLVREVQGGMITRVPLIEFMQWVVDPDMFEEDSKKLDDGVFQRVSELRFSDR